ncbi:MAG: hypothetical protein ACLUPF_09200 [Dorea sp.]
MSEVMDWKTNQESFIRNIALTVYARSEISRNNADFTAVLEKAGYTRKKKKLVCGCRDCSLKTQILQNK